VSGVAFRIDLIEWLAAHRHPVLTAILQAFTFLGELQGYILVIVLIYVAFDKRLAVRLSVVTLAAMSFNHALKTLIQRPFIGDGASRRCGRSRHAAADRNRFSTPSGHAMAGAAFYLSRRGDGALPLRIACVTCALLTGCRARISAHHRDAQRMGPGAGAVRARRRPRTALGRRTAQRVVVRWWPASDSDCDARAQRLFPRLLRVRSYGLLLHSSPALEVRW
jgi:hypothetical protein